MGRDSLRVNVAYKVARHLVARRQSKSGGIAVAANWDVYGHWRDKVLRAQLIDGFGPHVAIGKVCLDFGCGDGALSTTLMDAGAESVHGVDLSEQCLQRFAERLARYPGNRRPTYSRSTIARRIDLPDQKFDAIFCFDVLEHVMDYREIIFEWFRVLKPGGSVYIWWQPYWHPYGHHAFDWIPIPWAHVFLDRADLSEVCARIVDWDEFDAPIWDRNEDGTKKNRFRETDRGDHFLNRLTVRVFERICMDAGFKFSHREFQPFSMPGPARAISGLMTKVPMARDFFTAFTVYELQRPAA